MLPYAMIAILNAIQLADFDISKGSGRPQFVRDDIAVIKVDDTNISLSKLKAACLPHSEPLIGDAVHAGWSKPPPRSLLETDASGYIKYYRDFFKLWHLKMDVVKCEDPANFLENEKFPSNTSYPPGISITC